MPPRSLIANSGGGVGGQSIFPRRAPAGGCGAAEADTAPLCLRDAEKLAVPGARMSMKANITGHKDVLRAGDMLLQKGGVGLKFLHRIRKNYASTCQTTSLTCWIMSYVGSGQNPLFQ